MHVDNCVKVLTAGGNLTVGAMHVDHLVRLAQIASGHGVHLTVRGAIHIDNAVRVVMAGKGHVTIDVSGG